MTTPTAPQSPAGGPRDRSAPDRTLETNAYAISYRLLGDRPAAAAVAGIAAERLRQSGRAASPGWMYALVQFTLDQTVAPGAPAVRESPDDPSASIRTALRRRLARATPDERVAASLIHLAGYPPEFVGQVLGRSSEEAVELARVLAPPPGVAYRELGDPELTRTRAPGDGSDAPRRTLRQGLATVLVVVLLLAAVLAATQITGPRPTLGPPVDEGGLGTHAVVLPDQSAERWTADPTHE